VIALADQYPLEGAQEYRGWYPIDQGPNKGRGRWCPSQSKFNGRGGRHTGSDLFAPNMSNILAIRDGNIEYNVVNDADWGNIIYLYFKDKGVTYVAVYAHLDPSSAFPGVKSVKKGDIIGKTGCTGNAGGGTCDRTHACNGKTVLQDHLHLEVMDARTKTKQDAVAFFGFSPAYDDDTDQTCGSTAQTL
jgi:murein DD-endopeptidase MepM/ murein hydrolase activator NlpD